MNYYIRKSILTEKGKIKRPEGIRPLNRKSTFIDHNAYVPSNHNEDSLQKKLVKKRSR